MRRYWIICALITLWSLAGLFAWYSQSHADLGSLARTDPDSARAFAMMPQWAWAAYAIATWSAVAGSVALLVRSRHAVWLFVASLCGVVVQFGWSFLGSDILVAKGPGAAAFPAVIAVIAAAEIWWARRQATTAVLR